MARSWNQRNRRRGGVAPLFAVLAIPLLGMMAFSIDVGYICLVKGELQTAADAAALAGAQKLQDLYVQYNLPNQTQKSTILANATTNVSGGPMDTAKKFAAYNTAGGVSVTLRDADVTFGFTDANGNYNGSYTGFPNTISVVARRDGLQNGSVGLFFARVLGKGTQDLQATARATIYVGDVSNLQLLAGMNTRMLPIALDYNDWTTFYSTGRSPDNQIHPGPNGAPQIQIYPVPKSTSGNFSLLCIGPPDKNSPTFRTWIDYGMSSSDETYLQTNSLLPVSISSPKQWAGGPGLTDTLVSNFADALGKSNLIPLFKPVSTTPYQAASGTGQNSTFAIVGFASVQVSQCGGDGSNLVLAIQPMAIYDPTAVINKVTPAGTQNSANFSTPLTTFVAPKLSN